MTERLIFLEIKDPILVKDLDYFSILKYNISNRYY